jgi:hypothetical protein
MGARFPNKHWPVGVLALGAAYACSGNPEVVIRPTDVGQGGNSANGGNGGSGGSLGGRAGSSAGTIGTTGGSSGKAGAGGNGGNTGGTAGASSGGTAGDVGSGAFGGFPDIDFDYDAGMMGTGGACDQVVDKGTLVKRPMDIIISIDNSSSMAGEIQAVVDNINVDFASIIEASGIDYRVIMVSRYGNLTEDLNGATDYSVCIGPPLGNAACPTAPSPPLVNTARFFHHSTDIGSNNMWCRLLTSYTTADEYPNERGGWTDVAPNGWQDWLRPEAFKVFVGITDDRMDTDDEGDSGDGQNCLDTAGGINDPGGLDDNLAGAQTFDRALRQLAPTQFGAYDMAAPAMGRNYRWYSIIGMIPKAGMETTPYEATEPVETDVCTNGGGNNDGVAAGIGYQELSRMTGGLRYSNCLNDDFNAMFNAIAQGVIEGSRASCEYDVPTPSGGIVDFDQTTVSYLPGGNAGAAIDLTRAATDMDCTNNPGFYFNQDFTKIFLCPNTCVTVQGDDMAEVQLDFGCLGS